MKQTKHEALVIIFIYSNKTFTTSLTAQDHNTLVSHMAQKKSYNPSMYSGRPWHVVSVKITEALDLKF